MDHHHHINVPLTSSPLLQILIVISHSPWPKKIQFAIMKRTLNENFIQSRNEIENFRDSGSTELVQDATVVDTGETMK